MRLFLTFFILLSIKLSPQTFSSLEYEQKEDTLFVNYGIIGGHSNYLYKVDLSISSDGGRSFRIIPKSASGDIGYGQSPGNDKRIIWEPLKDSIELDGDNFIITIRGIMPGNSPEPEFISIPGGEFMMGDPFEDGLSTDENFQHMVKIDPFYLSKYEITNYQYALFLKKYGSSLVLSGEYAGEVMIYPVKCGLKFYQGAWIPDEGYEYNPVIGVTWFGAYEFCRFYGYRLPTEAEWEYAARELGANVRYGNGRNEIDPSIMNYSGSRFSIVTDYDGKEYQGRTIPVGGTPPNNLNIYQMSGNVWEWCQDWYASNFYIKSKSNRPAGVNFGRYKVIRGGSWFNSPEGVRTCERSFIAPHRYMLDIGFRPARSIKPL
jgi:formylglycine-generating enzyme